MPDYVMAKVKTFKEKILKQNKSPYFQCACYQCSAALFCGLKYAPPHQYWGERLLAECLLLRE